MTEALFPIPKKQTVSGEPVAYQGTPTVASLGLQVYLVPVASERERQIRDLMSSCEALRAEWECLFQRVIALLDEQALAVPNVERPFPSARHD
jgi:hypothetical protein